MLSRGCLTIPARATALALLVLTSLAALPARSDEIPLDRRGLPLWEIRVWNDFPVRLELESREALSGLLERVPIASFHREQIRFDRSSPGVVRVVFEPRVTEAEAEALRNAGYAFERIRDRERESRREMEETWRRQAAEGEAQLRTGERGVYHTHAQIGALLQQAETDHPAIAEFFDIGTSVQGRELWTIKISDNVGVEEAEPEVRLSGTMHGNEPPAQEMLLFLVDHLTDQYGVDPDVTHLVDNYEIYILPCLNPDGLTAGVRWNARGVDLNRNFPVPDGTIGDDGTWSEEKETIAFKSFGSSHDFVISANGHTGTLVVNYPWDYTYALAPDDAALIQLSLEYSTWNLPMYNGPFPQGITNGAQWYVVKGSLQDWSYADTGCIDVTLELSSLHTPPASWLDGLWDDNRESFLHYIKAARYGIHGTVTGSGAGAPLPATITVVGNAEPVTTDPDHGDWYKLLPSGTYDLVVTAEGYVERTITEVSTTWGTPTELDVVLDPVVTGAPVVAAGELQLVPTPNPFRAATSLRFGNPRADRLRLAIYDVRGRRVRALLDDVRPAGESTLVWDGRSDSGEVLASGVYFARLETGGRRAVSKLTLTR